LNTQSQQFANWARKPHPKQTIYEAMAAASPCMPTIHKSNLKQYLGQGDHCKALRQNPIHGVLSKYAGWETVRIAQTDCWIPALVVLIL